MDINPTIKRLLPSHFEEQDANADQEDLGAEMVVVIKSTPWNARPSTLTGSTTLLVRTRFPDGSEVVRLADAIEVMAMMGWPLEWWHQSGEPSYICQAALKCKSLLHFIELISNMAGNAFTPVSC